MALFKRSLGSNAEGWNTLAASRGARDGKGEKPTESWPSNSVPFLNEVKTRALKKALNLIFSTTAR